MAVTLESKIRFRRTQGRAYVVTADYATIGEVSTGGPRDWYASGANGPAKSFRTRGAAAEYLLRLATDPIPAVEDDVFESAGLSAPAEVAAEIAAKPAAERTITVYVSQYAPMEEGDDEPTKVFEDSEEFLISDYADDMGDWADRACTQWVVADAVTVAVRLLDGYRNRFYASEASASPTDGVDAWYSDAGYDHPYTGVQSEQTAHLAGFTEDEQRAIYAALVSRKALR